MTISELIMSGYRRVGRRTPIFPGDEVVAIFRDYQISGKVMWFPWMKARMYSVSHNGNVYFPDRTQLWVKPYPRQSNTSKWHIPK